MSSTSELEVTGADFDPSVSSDYSVKVTDLYGTSPDQLLPVTQVKTSTSLTFLFDSSTFTASSVACTVTNTTTLEPLTDDVLFVHLYPPPVLTSVSPSQLSHLGGNLMTLVGSGFRATDFVKVRIAHNASTYEVVVDGYFKNDGELSCTVPAFIPPIHKINDIGERDYTSHADVSVSLDGQSFVGLEVVRFYQRAVLRIGFAYSSPIDDFGWTFIQNFARMKLETEFVGRIETIYFESVQDADAYDTIASMIRSEAGGGLGCTLVFAGSFGYLQASRDAARNFPHANIVHLSGFPNYDDPPNIAYAFARIYQMRYLAGVIAGRTVQNCVGYMAAFDSVPEVRRGINAFAKGCRDVNPDCVVKVLWTGTWGDPWIERNAAQTMLDQGCDMLTQHSNTPEPQKVYSDNGGSGIGYNSDMRVTVGDSVLTSVMLEWYPILRMFTEMVLHGTWTPGIDYFGGAEDETVKLAAYAPSVSYETRAEVSLLWDAMARQAFKPFCGDLTLNTGEQPPAYLVDDAGCLTEYSLVGMNPDTFWSRPEMDWHLAGIEDIGWFPAPDPEVCPSGEMYVSGECLPCGAGTMYQNSTSLCVGCPAGFDQSGVAKYSCNPCGPGHFADESNTPECKSCAKGSFASDYRSQECELCSIGEYGPGTGRSDCEQCPDNSHAPFRGATHLEDCMCDKGFYDLRALNMTSESSGEEEEGGAQCALCPTGAFCAGGMSHPQALPMYWASPDDPTVMFLCLSEAMCPGGAPGTCGSGYEGTLCSSCGVDHYFVSGSCEECSSGSSGMPAVFTLLAFVVAGGMYKFTNAAELRTARTAVGVSSSVGLVVAYVQSFSLMLTFDVKWPDGVEDLLRVLSVVNVNVEMFQMNCVMNWSYSERLAFKMALPPLVIVVFMALMCMSHVYARFARWLVVRSSGGGGGAVVFADALGDERQKPAEGVVVAERPTGVMAFLGLRRGALAVPMTLNKTLNALGLSIEILYIFMLKTALELFECYEQPNGDRSLLSYPRIKCGDSEWREMLPLAVLGFFAYTTGVLLVFGYALYKAPQQPATSDLNARIRFLLLRFRPNKYYWGILLLLRKFALTFVTSLAADDGLTQASVSIGILLICLSLQLVHWPFFADSVNYLDAFLIVDHIAIILCSYAFITDSAHADAVSVLVVFMVVAAIMSGAVLTLYEFYAAYFSANARDRKKRLRAEHAKQLTSSDSNNGGGTDNPAVMYSAGDYGSEVPETPHVIRDFEAVISAVQGTTALVHWYDEACAFDRRLVWLLTDSLKADVLTHSVDHGHLASTTRGKRVRTANVMTFHPRRSVRNLSPPVSGSVAVINEEQ